MAVNCGIGKYDSPVICIELSCYRGQFEYSKWVIKGRKSIKDRPHNGKKRAEGRTMVSKTLHITTNPTKPEGGLTYCTVCVPFLKQLVKHCVASKEFTFHFNRIFII